MILSKADLMKIVNERITGEDDETLAILENITDTIDDYETRASGDGEDWKKKYEENDASWRQKYRERFFNSSVEETVIDKPEENTVEEESSEPTTFEDLFKEKED